MDDPPLNESTPLLNHTSSIPQTTSDYVNHNGYVSFQGADGPYAVPATQPNNRMWRAHTLR